MSLETNLVALGRRLETSNADARLRIAQGRRAGTWKVPPGVLAAFAQLLAADPQWGSFLESMTVLRLNSALDVAAEDREAYASYVASMAEATEAAIAALVAKAVAAATAAVPPPEAPAA